MAGKSPRLGPKQYRDNGDRCFAIAVTCTTTLAGEDHESRLIANCCDGRNDMSVPILHSRSRRENMVPTRKPPPGPMDHELAVIAVTLVTIQREARGPLASPHCCTVFGEAAGGKGASMGRKVLPECPRPRISGGPCELLSPRSVTDRGLVVVGRLRRQPFEDGLVTICLVLRARDRDVPSSVSHHDRSVLQHVQAGCHVLLPIHV